MPNNQSTKTTETANKTIYLKPSTKRKLRQKELELQNAGINIQGDDETVSYLLKS